jgi:hypothetical protein
MSLFRRRKQQNEATAETLGADLWGPIRMDAAAFMEALGDDSPWVVGGEFNLRAFHNEIYSHGLLGTMRVLMELGVDADEFWDGSNLSEQWDGGDRSEREDALNVAMRYVNAMDGATYMRDNLQVVKMHATMRVKALLLATGCDATYETKHPADHRGPPRSVRRSRLRLSARRPASVWSQTPIRPL